MADNYTFTEGSGRTGAAKDLGTDIIAARVVPVLGTTDAAGGAGAADAGTTRTVEASDSPVVSGIGATADAAATAGSTGSLSAKLRLMTAQLDAIQTAIQLLDNAVGGTELQVDVVAPLPAGTNNIGDVDVLSLPALPAGTNNIGDVDIASALPAGDNNIGNVDLASPLPAGTNNIGDVDVLSLPALPAGTNNIGDVDIASALPAGTNNIGDVDLASAIPAGTNLIGRVTPEGTEYETVAASQTDQALGATGATGDYLAGLLVVPATTSPGNVLIQDGAGSEITVFAGGADSVSNLVPFFVPLGIVSGAGAWQVTTGANVSCVAVGNFT